MSIGGGARGKRRDSTIDWTCDQDCWCHIPVRGVTPPPCYQCVLNNCSLSCKLDFTASAPELPSDDAYLSLSLNQASGAGGRDGTSVRTGAAGLRDPAHVSHTSLSSPISATPGFSHFRERGQNQTTPTGTPLVTPSATPPITPSRQDSPHHSHNADSARHSPYDGVEGAVGGTGLVSSRLVFLEPHTSDLSLCNISYRDNDNSLIQRTHALVSSDTHSRSDQSLVLGDPIVDDKHLDQTSPPLSGGVMNLILGGDETVTSDTEDSEVAGYIPTTEQGSSPSQASESGQNMNDLSTRLKMLLLTSEDQELPQANRTIEPTNWTVSARGLTVCACGDMHRCHAKRQSNNQTFKKRNQQSFPAARRPRYTVTSEVRGTHSSRPHSTTNLREYEFRNINRITGRDSARDAARRYLHSVIKP